MTKEERKSYNKNYWKDNKQELLIKAKPRKSGELYKKYMKKYIFKKRYGLSLEEIDEILAKQNHKCKICGKSLKETRRCIDHNHETGVLRGILCQRCNLGLGYIEDETFLKNALNYLKHQ